MKLRGKMVLVILFILYFAARWARSHFSELPSFFKNHFTDLLFIPVQLIVALWGTRILKRDSKIEIPLVWIILQVIFVSILFEWYMPNYGSNAKKFTGDLVDVCMYIIGGLLFAGFQRWESTSN